MVAMTARSARTAIAAIAAMTADGPAIAAMTAGTRASPMGSSTAVTASADGRRAGTIHDCGRDTAVATVATVAAVADEEAARTSIAT
jgi:hypothetical protein